MKVLVIGATGAVGQPLVRQLVKAGHQVTGTTRTLPSPGAQFLTGSGATAVALDLLDRDSVLRTVTAVRPDAIIHQATALASAGGNLRRFDEDFALTNRLRTEGMASVLAAAEQCGGARILAQSFTGWPNERTGGWVKSEDDPLDARVPKAASRTMAAIKESEALVTASGGLVLRYGAFYGPGSNLFGDGSIAKLIRARRFPVVGKGTGVWSFIHLEDAAAATVAALEHAKTGVYNVVDDDPAPVAQWLPALAAALGARAPLAVPALVGRLAGGELAVAMMTTVRGSSNAKAKRELGWQPAHPSWRTGFAESGA